ncbi:uncharacterized protein IAS62_002676 [Cryptococcus decagattii]|uniref:Uncharacterized protein n=1 Tax=Cryptococcus decagattii TaxID=1859122 RepID=A0ABZ2AS65_9TREE
MLLWVEGLDAQSERKQNAPPIPYPIILCLSAPFLLCLVLINPEKFTLNIATQTQANRRNLRCSANERRYPMVCRHCRERTSVDISPNHTTYFLLEPLRVLCKILTKFQLKSHAFLTSNLNPFIPIQQLP